jgi:phosphatidylglycerophosphate synthase
LDYLRGIMAYFRGRNMDVTRRKVMTMHNGDVKRHRHANTWAFSINSSVKGAPADSWFTWTQRRQIRTTSLGNGRIWLVQSISIARLCASIVFAALASKDVSVTLLSCIYVFAVASDLLDGYASRKLKAETYLGNVMDLVADKALTIVSMIYAASRGIDILPIALIASRDIIMIGMRLVIIQGAQLLPTNRIFGGAMALALWGNTLMLVWAKADGELLSIANVIYWACAMIFAVNLLARLYASGPRIKAASNGGLLPETSTTGNCRECGCTCEPSSPKHLTSV